jgi:hypothetical protein
MRVQTAVAGLAADCNTIDNRLDQFASHLTEL